MHYPNSRNSGHHVAIYVGNYNGLKNVILHSRGPGHSPRGGVKLEAWPSGYPKSIIRYAVRDRALWAR
jgi:hypothetical protein